MKKKALLILIGGRQIPNVLTAQSLQPDVIFPVATQESMQKNREWNSVAPILRQLCPDGLHEPVVVNGENWRESYDACLKILRDNLDYEWVFNITCGPKVLALAAYDVALPMIDEHNISIWYLASSSRTVEVLKGKKADSDLYKIDVQSYFKSYGWDIKCKNPESEEIRISRMLVRHPEDAKKFVKSLDEGVLTGNTMKIELTSEHLIKLLEPAKVAGLINEFRIGKIKYNFYRRPIIQCEIFTSKLELLKKFFNGGWLETYTYWSAINSSIFDDVRMGVAISKNGISNEIDLAATRSGALLVVECKTSTLNSKQYDDKLVLDKFNSVTELVGGNFVQKLLVISAKKLNNQRNANFMNKASSRRIVLVSWEELPELAEIFRRESGAKGTPTYPLI